MLRKKKGRNAIWGKREIPLHDKKKKRSDGEKRMLFLDAGPTPLRGMTYKIW